MFSAARQMSFNFVDPPVREVTVAETCSRMMGMDDELTSRCVKLLVSLGMNDLADRVSVEWNPRMRSSAGRATWPVAMIELNTRLPEISQEEVRRTLLHELAHLIAYERSGNARIQAHGPEWQEACAEVGIPGEKATHELDLPSRSLRRQWRYQCPGCGTSFDRVRRFKSRVACYDCCRKMNSGEYHEGFRLQELSLVK